MRLYVSLLAAALVWLAQAPAAAQTTCSAISDTARCLSIIREAGRHFRLSPLETYEERGDQIRRVLTFTRGYQGHVAISFVRSPGDGPKIVVTAPPNGAGDEIATMAAPLSGRDWENVLERSKHFDRALVPQPDNPILCGDGAPVIVEANDPLRPGAYVKSALRRRAEHSCDRGLADAFAHWAADFALERFPACAHLRMPGLQERTLADCARFSGDRAAAGQAYEQAFEFRQLDDAERAAEFRRLFSAGARLSWDGNQLPGHAADAWRDRISGADGGRYFHFSAHGETPYRVRIRGMIERGDAGAPSGLVIAPVEMDWEGSYGEFRITRIAVGPFAAKRDTLCPLRWREMDRHLDACVPV